jgi:hypothetical protein
MPLVILAVAGGLIVWSTHRRAEQAEDVRQLVVGLCADLAAGRDPAARLQATDTLITGPLLERLRSVTGPARGQAGALAVEVQPGDTPEAGTVGLEATHTALILLDGRQVLGLRVMHPGESADIAIIGFWSPPPS